MTKPIAVLISDIHFSLNNLELSTQALKAAIQKAEELDVQLIIAGDLQDNKAIIRAEVANRLLDLFRDTNYFARILVGNHDLINEKGEDNALNYLRDRACVYSEAHLSHLSSNNTPVYFIPYQNSTDKFLDILKDIPKGSIIIMHQGVKGAFMGDYIQDKTSVDSEVLEDYRVFSGHYHRHQTVGTVTYIGNPFTMSFGEANDGPKGFLVLNDDGSYERVTLSLRRHLVIERDFKDLGGVLGINLGVNPDDLVWLKVRGKRSELATVKKSELLLNGNFKLDLIAEEDTIPAEESRKQERLTDTEILDKLIDSTSETPTRKNHLKELYREIITG